MEFRPSIPILPESGIADLIALRKSFHLMFGKICMREQATRRTWQTLFLGGTMGSMFVSIAPPIT